MVQVNLCLCIDGLGCIDVLPSFCELVYLVSTIYFPIIMSCKNVDAIILYLSYILNYSMKQSPS